MNIDRYYTIEECWNHSISLAPSEFENLSIFEIKEKVKKVFKQTLKNNNLATGNEFWIENYVEDNMQIVKD